MEQITSRENKLVKLACALGRDRKARREQGLFLTAGTKLCGEAAACGVEIAWVLMTGAWMRRCPEEALLLQNKAAHAALLAEGLANKISDQAAPQGVFCLCGMSKAAPEPDFSSGGRYLALDTLQDPGNLGTIIRTADAFGLSGLILGPGCADRFSPKVLRATMGSAFRLPTAEVEDLPSALDRAQKAGFAVYGAALDRKAQRLSEVCFPARCVAVVGNEGNGISPEVLSRCGRTVFIDMKGGAESLNAGVAAAVLLWEMSRERK